MRYSQKDMKNLRKFGFEILIIFSGITLSFLFDEWRTNRNQIKRTTEILSTIDAEITDYFKRGHRLLTRRDTLVYKFQSNSISIEELADLIVYINADPNEIRLLDKERMTKVIPLPTPICPFKV